MQSFTFRAEVANLRTMLDAIHQFAEEQGFGGQPLHFLEVAAEEAFVNIVHHGYDGNSGDVVLELDVPKEGFLKLVIKDKGLPFNPLQKETDLQESRPLEERSPGGLGIFLFKEICDKAGYERVGDENVLTLLKDMRGKST